jgi:hypothetical protein
MSPAECLRDLPTRSHSDGHESISKFQAPPSRSEIPTRLTEKDSLSEVELDCVPLLENETDYGR